MAKGCTCGGSYHSPFIHFWQRMTARALTIEVVYYHGDDEGETKREVELSIPSWVWRPRCWLKGHDEGYGECIICRADLTPKSRKDAP